MVKTTPEKEDGKTVQRKSENKRRGKGCDGRENSAQKMKTDPKYNGST